MRLKELRIEKGLTQWDVAKGIETGQSNIGRWERDEVLPTSDFIIKLADFFQVSTDYLLEREDDFGNISIEKNAPQITSEELQIIEDFRALSIPGKQLIKTTMRTLLDKSNEVVERNRRKA